MARRVTVNVGFITNSSSCVYYFPKEVLDDPKVKAFIEAHELSDGYLGADLWSRSTCSSFLVSKEQKERAVDVLRNPGWNPDYVPEVSKLINPQDDGAYIIYGDEYSDTTHILCELLSSALGRINGVQDGVYHNSGYLTDFN